MSNGVEDTRPGIRRRYRPAPVAGRLLTGGELREVLTEPAHWLWPPSRRAALSVAQREVLVCAAEVGGITRSR